MIIQRGLIHCRRIDVCFLYNNIKKENGEIVLKRFVKNITPKKKQKRTLCLIVLAAGAMWSLIACQNKTHSEYLNADSSSPINEISMSAESSSVAETSSPKTNSYSNKVIKFDYPGDWTLEKKTTEDTSYVDFFDSNSGGHPVFWYSRGEAWITDFNRTEEDYKTLLSESYPDIVITDLTKTAIDGNDAVKLVFHYTSNDTEYTMTQYETIVGYVSFQFNCTYKSDMSDDYEIILNTIISSIEFIS